MSRNIVYQGQSFFDKVIEITGDIDNAFTMSLLNETPMTDPMEIGRELIPGTITKRQIVDLFNEKNRPATEYIEAVDEPTNQYELPGEFPYSF